MKDFKIKPIKSEKDYHSAISALEGVFNAKAGSPEADIRDVLSILIEKYEDEKYPISLPPPLGAIKFRMEQEGLSNQDLVPYIGSRSKVSEVLAGKRELTLKMIRALHKHLGISAEVLLQDSDVSKLQDFEIDFEKFPVIEMAKNGAFKGLGFTDLKDRYEEAIRFLIKKIGGDDAIPEGLFRTTKSARLNVKVDRYALQGWSLQVLSDAIDISVKKYKKENINENFIKHLVGLSSHKKGPLLVREHLANHGIVFVIVPHLKNTYLDGGAFITREGIPVIGLTLRYGRIDNFWFTLLHEIGHLKYHLTEMSFIVDDMTLRGSSTDDDKEKEADNFAESALLPKNFNLDHNEFISCKQIEDLASEYNIHPAIIAGRIQHNRNNYRIFANLVRRDDVRKLFFTD